MTSHRVFTKLVPYLPLLLLNVFLREIFGFFPFLYVLYSTLLRLPPLRFHCVGGRWEWTQDCCDFGIGCQTL